MDQKTICYYNQIVNNLYERREYHSLLSKPVNATQEDHEHQEYNQSSETAYSNNRTMRT